MKKDYAVNIKTLNSDNDWETADMADWFDSYESAFEAAEKAFEDSEVLESIISIWKDGEIEDSPLHMVRENGNINQYQDGQLLWL